MSGSRLKLLKVCWCQHSCQESRNPGFSINKFQKISDILLQKAAEIRLSQTASYLVPFWGEGRRLLQPLLACAAVRNRLAPVSQTPFILTRRGHQQVRVRLGQAAGQLQVPRGAHSCAGARVPGLLVHSGINRFRIAVCKDGSHAGSSRLRWSSGFFWFDFGGFPLLRLALVGWQDSREGVLAGVDDGRRSVQEAGELLRDTCSLILARMGAIWTQGGGEEKVSLEKEKLLGARKWTSQLRGRSLERG